MTHSDFQTGAPPQFMPGPRPTLSSGLSILGIVGMVLGALGVMTNLLCGVGATAAMMLVGDSIPAEMQTSLPDGPWMWAALGLNLVNGLVSVLLLTASIMIMRRKPSGAGLYQVWAIIRIVAVLASVPVTYAMQIAQFESMDAQATGGMDMSSMATGIAIFTAIWTLVWGTALPIFSLIWFRRTAVREEIAQWSLERSGDVETVYP